MDLRLRFIEESDFEVDDFFLEKINTLSEETSFDLLYDLSNSVKNLPYTDGWSEIVFGVVKRTNFFYVIDYYKEEGQRTYIIDIDTVDVDEYLDAINQSNTIKHYENRSRNLY